MGVTIWFHDSIIMPPAIFQDSGRRSLLLRSKKAPAVPSTRSKGSVQTDPLCIAKSSTQDSFSRVGEGGSQETACRVS